jgi:hemolysin III
MRKLIRRLREPVNGLTHFFACLAAAVAVAILLIGEQGDLAREVSLGIYGLSLTLLFAASAAYHLAPLGRRGTAVLRRLDHSAIYLLIAGTYTPFCVLAFSGFWRWGLLGIIWSLALIGIVVKMFMMHAPRWLSAGTYVIMGWLCLAGIGQMLQALPVSVLIWLAAGGLLYTLGALVYITKALDFMPGRFGFHEVWHIFVILGAVAHFVAVAAYLAGRHPGL